MIVPQVEDDPSMYVPDPAGIQKDSLCEACRNRRYHRPEEWANHPLAGHGFTKETGWSHPQLAKKHQKCSA